MSFWKRKKKKYIKISDVTNVQIKEMNYHPKVILAWAKAVEGNKELLQWLNENGYEELALATYAIYLKNEARDWLVANGYAHLMAFINAAEGNEKAQNWLKTHQFDVLYHMALAIEDEQESWAWLSENATSDIFLLTKSIKTIKDKIELNHNDIHSFGKDL